MTADLQRSAVVPRGDQMYVRNFLKKNKCCNLVVWLVIWLGVG